MREGRPLTTALGIAILAMLALTVLPAQQRETPARVAAGELSPLDYIEIQQLVRKSAWALTPSRVEVQPPPAGGGRGGRGQ